MKSIVQKTEEGQERNDAWRALSPSEQLADLDRRLGKGVGATRQRKKLASELEPTNDPPNGGNPGGGFTDTKHSVKRKKTA